MIPSRSRRCRVLVFACLVSAVLAAPAWATHFRYGHITWTHVSGVGNDRTIAYTVTNAWRQDAVSNGAYRCVNPASFLNQATALPTVACTGLLIAGERNPGPGDVFVELQGGTRFDFGDGRPTVGGPGGDPLLYLVTSLVRGRRGSRAAAGSAPAPRRTRT